jgi:hypothetical protein
LNKLNNYLQFRMMNIFESTNKELSSKVSDGLSEFISEKVEEELTKRKDTFMKGLNMCEEEYPVYRKTTNVEFNENTYNMLVRIAQFKHPGSNDGIFYQPTKPMHNIYQNREEVQKARTQGVPIVDIHRVNTVVAYTQGFIDDYTKLYNELDTYYKSHIDYPHIIIGNNHFIIPIKGNTFLPGHSHMNRKDLNICFGITNKGIVYTNIPKAKPCNFVVRHVPTLNGSTPKPINFAQNPIAYKLSIKPHKPYSEYLRAGGMGLCQDTTGHTSLTQEITLLPPTKCAKDSASQLHCSEFNHLHEVTYDLSKYIRVGTCKAPRIFVKDKSGRQRSLTYGEVYECMNDCKPYSIQEGSGCQCGVFIKHTQVEIEGTSNHEYTLEYSTQYDSVRRCIEGDICKDCGSGGLLSSVEDMGFDPRVINKTPLTQEYIDILNIMNVDAVETIFSLQTIFAKYHPRASENYVIEEKIQALSDMEKAVDERVKLEKEALAIKSKEVTEQRLQNMVTQLILRKDTQDIENKRKSIRGILAHTEQKCAIQVGEIDKQRTSLFEQVAEQRNTLYKDLYVQKTEFLAECSKMHEECSKMYEEYTLIAQRLHTIANDLNIHNELQSDTGGKSDELFSIMNKLQTLDVHEHTPKEQEETPSEPIVTNSHLEKFRDTWGWYGWCEELKQDGSRLCGNKEYETLNDLIQPVRLKKIEEDGIEAHRLLKPIYEYIKHTHGTKESDCWIGGCKTIDEVVDKVMLYHGLDISLWGIEHYRCDY